MSKNNPGNHLVTNASAEINQNVTSPAVKLTITLNPGTTSEQALSVVDHVCSTLAQQQTSVEHLRVILGRVLAEVQDRMLYRPAFDNFEAFTIDLANRHRLSRSTLRDSLMIARRLPSMDPAEAEEMPLSNLTLVARVARTAEPKTVTAILKDAKRLSVTDFRARMESRGFFGKRGRPTVASKTVTIRIRISRTLANRWFAYVGDSDPAAAFAALIPAAAKKAA